MVREENNCCGCAVPGYPCLGTGCLKRHERVLICDNCKEESEYLYIVDGEQLCEECLLMHFEKIE